MSVPKHRFNTSGVTALQYVDDAKKQQSRSFRKNGTPADKMLWSYLRNRKANRLKFRRQQVIEGFIVDFYCEELKLIIDVDGPVHDSQKQKKIDKHRRAVFKTRAIREIRFRNDEVLDNISDVVNRIITACEKGYDTILTPSPALPRIGEGRNTIHHPDPCNLRKKGSAGNGFQQVNRHPLW
jgi:very-short-patch-repair endonuclease